MSILRTFSFYLAVIGFIFIIAFIKVTGKPAPPIKSVQAPAMSPFKNYIAASGLVEAVDKNIDIGVPEDGVVEKVWVRVGDVVEKGDPLFQIDSRSLDAKLIVQKANIEVAKAKLLKQKDKLDRVKSVEDPRAISRDELQTYENDYHVSLAELDQSKAEVKETLELIERLKVRAPKDGAVLQEDIREGEYVARDKTGLIIGNLEHLQVRTNIDEQNAGLFNKINAAVAFPKNNTNVMIPLHFVRIEPYVIPKTSLTGVGSERVDTRVLQVIYSFEPPKNYNIFVGQQLDVFIEKNEPSTSHLQKK